MSNLEQGFPEYAAIFKPGASVATSVTDSTDTMKFYASHSYSVRALVFADEARNAIVAARAMMSIYQQCFSRGTSAKPGDKVVFDNGLFPLTAQEEHALSTIDMMIGRVFTVDVVTKKLGSLAVLTFIGMDPALRFPANKFLILPK